MKRVSKWTGFVAGAVLALVIGFLLVKPAIGEGEDKKTLDRSEDPVVVLAKDFRAMHGTGLDKLALFAYDGSAFKPIPFQVDERSRDGFFVYTDGPKADPKKGNGKYDALDELVFMAWDAGDLAAAGTALPCEPTRAGQLEITDPIKGGKAWVYLAECGGEPPRSSADYVRNEYDGTHDWVKTDRYHFAEQRGTTFFDRLALKGSSGKVGPNLIDRLKGRTHITAAGGMIDLKPDETAVAGSIQAWIDGPVRVIHKMQGYAKLSAVKIEIGGGSENLFYANYFVTPIKINLPVDVDKILQSFSIRYTIDWLKIFEGTKYYDPINTKGMVLDGKMSDDEKNMDFNTNHEWYALTGPQGNLVVRMVIPGVWKKKIPIKLYYVDDLSALDPPESDPGQRCPGLFLDNMIDIPAGDYQYNMYYMVPDQAPPKSVPDMLNILDQPLQVSAREFK